MKTFAAIALLASIALSPLAQAKGKSCNRGCEGEHQQCLTLLGVAAQGNCGESFRLCVQRCNPSGLNMVYLESQSTERLLQSHVLKAQAKRVSCAGDCLTERRIAKK